MQEWFVPSLIEIGQMFHSNRFFPIYKCKICFPSCGPSRTIICISLNLHYDRKLSCKYELFWFSGSRGEFFFSITNFDWNWPAGPKERRTISLRHSSILRRIWLNFMALCLVFIRRLFHRIHFFSSDFQLFRTEHHWRDLSSPNAHLVHQNW
jgi:hypothetical protein